jgi:hypothetical protein
MIMINGCDEISPSYTKEVSIILKEIHKMNAGKLWVMSCTVMRHKLEEDF